ncbi:MAG TPA: cytochrome c oxidase subunit II [Anaerolineales bacterium]|nr:cytochrome c oxidase subunit II [Anaerolineales bacterium]
MLGNKKKRGIVFIWLMTHIVLLSACAAGAVENSYIRTPSMLAPQGPVAARIAGLSWFMIVLGSLIFLGVMAYFAYAAWGHRGYSLEEELKRPNQGNGIVLTWGVGFTAVVLVVLFGVNIGIMRSNNQLAAGEEALVIDVIGHQWWWEIQYPEQGFETANEIHIPVGQPVTLRLVTRDVIHSLWIPELSGKLDLLPNQVNELTLVADKTGEYWGECAEFCGTQHAKMQLMVIVQTEGQFNAWLEHQQTMPAPPEDELTFEGQQVFLGSSCVYCHTVRGTNASGDLGPDLTHVMSRRTLGAGVLENSLGNMAGWVVDAQAIKPGNKMPPMDLNAAELSALLAYLETLE